jgi:hypothetical protein
MKKFLSLFLAVLISLSLLTGSALAKAGNGNKPAGAPGQQQVGGKSDKGNGGKGAANGKGNAGSQAEPDEADRKDQSSAGDDGTQNDQSGNDEYSGQKNGNSRNQESKNPQFFRQGNHLNVQAISDLIGQLTDSDLSAKLTGLLTAYKGAKPGHDAQEAWTALLDALKAAGVSVDAVQPVRRWRYEQQGKPIDVDAISTAIGQLADTDTAAKLNELLTAYKTAEVGKAVQEARTALLDALEAAGIDVDSVQPPMNDEQTTEDEPINVEAISAAIGKLADSATASQLTALLTAYQDAVSTSEDAVQTALTTLLEALKAAGITEGIE